MFQVKVQLIHNISDQLVADLLVTVFEGGSNYWVGGAQPTFVYDQREVDTNWYGTADFLKKVDWGIKVYKNEEEEGEIVEINRHNLEMGFNIMAKDYRKAFDNIVTETFDAEDADIWFQCSVLGGVVYG